MTLLTELEPWWRFAAVLLVGALIGLEREFIQQRQHEREFAGIRTFPLIAMLGAGAAYLEGRAGALAYIAGFAALALLVLGSYVISVYRGSGHGMTTQVAALLCYQFGALIIWDYAELGVALGVVTALVLALKPPLHGAVRRMSAEDLRATLEFAIVAAVVLPILPNRALDPLGVLNPFSIWLLVVFVSGIGFLGYVLMKALGTERGIGLTAVLGGVVSSTASTLSFSSRSKSSPRLSPTLAWGILFASSIMFPRILVEVAVVHPPLLGAVAVPLGAMFAASLGMVAYLAWRRPQFQDGPQEEVEVTNPLRLSTAVAFGLAFAVVLVVVRVAQDVFGSAGVYAAASLTGLTGVDAITLSMAELTALGQVAPDVAAVAIVLAAISNTTAKAVLAVAYGAPQLRRTVLLGFGVVVAVGVMVGATILVWK
ncbi:MAG: MgtC/SapB family protein [Anaerolineae bacterium]|nr:MgtC/SapB family protein [Anaerolineae bacterium]